MHPIANFKCTLTTQEFPEPRALASRYCFLTKDSVSQQTCLSDDSIRYMEALCILDRYPAWYIHKQVNLLVYINKATGSQCSETILLVQCSGRTGVLVDTA